MHNFVRSLKAGKAGETLLAQIMPQLEPLNGRGSDFRHRETGELWELKTDSYDMAKTANFFIEFISNDKKMSKGGPIQALEHGSKYWCYMFSKNRTIFIFDTQALVDYINTKTAKYPIIEIPNKGYNTLGFKIPRADLKHLFVIKEF